MPGCWKWPRSARYVTDETMAAMITPSKARPAKAAQCQAHERAACIALRHDPLACHVISGTIENSAAMPSNQSRN